MSGFGVIIPARYASKRLPGKPLREVAGRPLIAHVCDRAAQSGADFVIVATDDPRVGEAARAAGVESVLTSPDHRSGTDRVAEVVRHKRLADSAIVVNLQGDEPLTDPTHVGLVAAALESHPDAGLSTLATRITSKTDLFDESVVKVVLADGGLAHYFSRAPIPWHRGWHPATYQIPNPSPFLRHIGLYGYRVATLARVASATPAPAERLERLEQLRALGLGLGIHVTEVETSAGTGVDTEADLDRVSRILASGV